MKTIFRVFALCLLMSHARGFATTWTDILTKATTNAIPTLAAIWVAFRVLDVAHVVADKSGDVNETLGTVTGKIVDVVDPRVTLPQVFGCQAKK